MRLIIFTGAPASGKSSLAEYVGKVLKIKVISKDGFKIALYEKYGFKNHAEKKKLSIEGEHQLHQYIKDCINKNVDLIVDNNFKNFDELRKIISESNNNVYVKCICCVADYDILARRYNERITSGNRHAALYTLNQYPIIDGISEFHKPIDANDVQRIQECVTEHSFGDDVLEVNTTNIDVEFDKICLRVIDYVREV